MTVNNLYVSYDADGVAHHYVNDDEVPKDVWLQQHPHLRKGKFSGGNSDSGRGGTGDDASSADDEAKEQVRQGIREQRQQAKAERARGSGYELG